MKSPVTLQLLEEIARFDLKFTCEDCAQFEPASEACSLGYPNGDHRAQRASADHIVFCKEFELA